jgi:transcriptional regulator with XRE-family HTH domain
MNVEALKSALAERDMSQNELARKVGCSCGHMSNIVNGRREPRTDVFKRMCEELRKKPQELL